MNHVMFAKFAKYKSLENYPLYGIFTHGCMNYIIILTALLLNAYRSKDDTRVVDQAQVNFNSFTCILFDCVVLPFV